MRKKLVVVPEKCLHRRKKYESKKCATLQQKHFFCSFKRPILSFHRKISKNSKKVQFREAALFVLKAEIMFFEFFLNEVAPKKLMERRKFHKNVDFSL